MNIIPSIFKFQGQEKYLQNVGLSLWINILWLQKFNISKNILQIFPRKAIWERGCGCLRRSVPLQQKKEGMNKSEDVTESNGGWLWSQYLVHKFEIVKN